MLISIHAPHARSDQSPFRPLHQATDFNPRSSCEERRYRFDAFFDTAQFQSTLLMRGATATIYLYAHNATFQSTLLMRGATRRHSDGILNRCISIHAPHARSDNSATAGDGRRPHFNPRSSCEERRHHAVVLIEADISIHAPHARSDAEVFPLIRQ